ncbi:MAG TPA: ABC transporter ATP-binding protein [Nitrococcus sp.]|nr:ABC transporter ATP-binding protein [Nitrococcus sp.]
MATLQTRNLTTHFGNVKAVNGVSLDVADGELLVLLGASGSGKSTLMRTVAGLEKPTSGEVFIGGRLANNLTPKTRNIAMVFQSYALYPHKSVFKNIAFPLEAVRMPAATIKAKVDWAASLLGIAHLLGRKPRALSGGERQRVALARALVREPALSLMDEPLSNLDAKLRHSARRELKRIHQETGVTMIYVTHDQVEAMGLGQRVAIMNHGRIEQIGTPLEIYHQPTNTFVAQFMGSPPMNLMRRHGAIVGFHAEDLRPRAPTSGDASELMQLTFEVIQVEDLGPDALVYGYIREDESERRPEIIAKLPALEAIGAIEQGRDYPFVVAHHAIRRFDPNTGLRAD